MFSESTRRIVTTVVAVAWLINFAAGLFMEEYDPSESVNAIFMGIVGALYSMGSRKDGDTDV